MDSDTFASDVKRGLAWSSLSNLVMRAGTFAVGIALARLLTPDQFGVYAVALAVQGVLMTLADLGLSADLIRSSDPERRAPTVGTLGLVSGTSMAVIMALTAAPLANMLGSPESADAIALLSLTLALAGAGVVPFAFLQRHFRQKDLFVIGVVDFLVSTTITIGLILAGWGVLSLAVGRVVAQSVTLVLQFRFAGVRPRYGIDRAILGSVMLFGAPIAGANMLSWAVLNVDNIVIAKVAGPMALGFYVLAFNISNWPMSAIGQVVRSVSLPAFSRTRENPHDVSLVRGAALTWAFALPAGALLAVLAPPLINVVYGTQWSPSAPVLAALALFGALRVVFDLFASFLLAHGASRTVLLVQVLWFAALVPAMVVATGTFGIQGGAWVHLVMGIAVILPLYLVAVRSRGTHILRLLGACVPPTLAAAPAVFGAYIVSNVFDSSLTSFLLGGVTGALIYGSLVFGWLKRAVQETSNLKPTSDQANTTRKAPA